MNYKRLTLEERKEIRRLLDQGLSRKEIAILINRSTAVVIKEVLYNSVNGYYDPFEAEKKSIARWNQSRSKISQSRSNQFQLQNQRISNLEFQMEIILDQLKEILDNVKNK